MFFSLVLSPYFCSFYSVVCFTTVQFIHHRSSDKVSITDYEEFQALLAKQAPIETYTEWLDDIIDKCVLQVLTP